MDTLIERPVQSKQRRAIMQEIAEITETPIEQVDRVYNEEFAALNSTAKVKQFVGVIASRRAKLRLRH